MGSEMCIRDRIKTPDEQISQMATRISQEMRTPDDQIQQMADQISDQITFDGGTVKDMAERISRQIKTPDDQISDMASRISQEVRTPDDQIESMAMSLAIKLTQKERLVAAKIPPYQELITQVSDSNQQQDYEKTIEILDEDIANRNKGKAQAFFPMQVRTFREVRHPQGRAGNVLAVAAFKDLHNLIDEEQLLAKVEIFLWNCSNKPIFYLVGECPL